MAIDLTALYSDPFEYEIRKGEERVRVVLDFDQIAMDLQQRIPTALTGSNLHDESGRERTGLEVVFDCWKTGKQHPDHLPSINHVLDAIGKAFKLPDDPGNGPRVKMALLQHWMTELGRRDARKKNTSGSPT